MPETEVKSHMYTMTNNYTKPADALKQSQNSKNSGAVGYTTRGTAIVNSNTELGQNAFLNILVAELSNMDPTQDQDSTAYVTQMAEFASIEQLNNLNTTMKNFSYQQMVGQVAILSEKDKDGNSIYGVITQIFKSGTGTVATIKNVTTGESKNYDVSKIIGTCDTGYNDSIYETALNSHYQSAILLAGTQSEAVILDYTSTNAECMDEDGNTLVKTTTTNAPVRCKVVGAYLDKVNSKVMITVEMLDAEGNNVLDEDGEKVIKDYDYSMVAIAGALDDKIKETYDKYKTAEPTITYTNKLTGAVVSNPKLKAEETESTTNNNETQTPLASALANVDKKAIVSEVTRSENEDGDTVETVVAKKCVIKGARYDSENARIVYTVALLDSDGNESSEKKEYTSDKIIVPEGSYTDEELDTEINRLNTPTQAVEGVRSINNSYSNEEILNSAIASENDILSKILES